MDAEDEWGDFSGPEMAEWNQPAPEPVPVLRYAFGKSGQSVRIKDRSGHGNDGTAARPLRRVPGIVKGRWAARFDGEKDYIRVPRSPSLEPEELTVDAWVCIDGSKPDFKDGAIAFKRNTASSCNEDYCLEILSDRTVLMTVSSPSTPPGQHRLITCTSLAPDLWHHLAMTFRPGEAVVYVDGKESARMQSGAGMNGKEPARLDHNSSADLFIGTRDHATYPLGRFGTFDLAELRIWPKALDANRISVLYGEHAGEPGVAKPSQNKACRGVEALCPAAIAAESLVLHLAPGPSGKTTATVRDRSGRNHHGTACAACVTATGGHGGSTAPVRISSACHVLRHWSRTPLPWRHGCVSPAESNRRTQGPWSSSATRRSTTTRATTWKSCPTVAFA